MSTQRTRSTSLKKSGLGRHALEWDPAEPLPTLREMIQRRRNVLVFAGFEGEAEPWYIPAYDAMAETPYRFDTRGDFSCEQSRGVEGNPLFLINHWVTAPDPLLAADVNRSEVLLDRVEECAEERGRRRTSSPSTSTRVATCSTSSPSSTPATDVTQRSGNGYLPMLVAASASQRAAGELRAALRRGSTVLAAASLLTVRWSSRKLRDGQPQKASSAAWSFDSTSRREILSPENVNSMVSSTSRVLPSAFAR